MYGCDQTVTLTHLHYDGDADRDVKEETTLTGVSWYGQAKTAVDSTGPARGAGVQMPHPGKRRPRWAGHCPRRQDHLRHRDRHRAGRA